MPIFKAPAWKQSGWNLVGRCWLNIRNNLVRTYVLVLALRTMIEHRYQKVTFGMWYRVASAARLEAFGRDGPADRHRRNYHGSQH